MTDTEGSVQALSIIGKCQTPKGLIFIANSRHFVKKGALFPNKSVYIDDFNALNARLNGE